MDKAEAGLRAQTGEKPEGGYYTSSERITLQKFSLGRITTLPRSVFGGRTVGGGGGGNAAGGGAGGGGAVAAGSAIVVRPQTSLVDRAQTLQIQTNAQSIGGLQQSLDVIRVQVTELNQGIQNTARQLQAESALEQNQLKQEQESERRLAERRVRIGKESELEKNIQAALARPIAKIQQTMTSLFDRVMGALTTLFFGWLTNQGIETLKALAEEDSKKLEEIKNTVIKNVLFAIGGFAAVNIGFGLLLRTISGLTLKLASLATRIALAPFRLGAAALRGGMSALRGIGSRVTGAGGVLGKTGGVMSRFLGGVKNLGKGTQGILRGTGNVASKLFAPIALGVGTYRISQGDIVGGLLSYGSAIPGVGLGFAGLDIAREFGFGKGTFFGKQESKPQQAQPQKTPSAAAPAAAPASPASPASPAPSAAVAQPQTPAMPTPSEITFSVDTANMLQGPPQALSQETAPPYDTMNVEGLLQEKPPAADVQAPPKPTTPVGTLPEAKPNIIMAGGGRDRTQTIASQQQPLTDVPFIPSANTDNFYVLYSQLNYNVVM